MRMPVVFTAHGNPMNAIRDNAFTRFLASWSAGLPRPRAIVAISAHWESPGILVTGSERPGTIHDFFGFPRDLSEIRYAAPGDPALARRTVDLLGEADLAASIDPGRGIDHGVWSPLRRLYPGHEIPVVQVSLQSGVPMEAHIAAGEALAPLRDEEILILGSGNLVHNLHTADLGLEDAPPESWALEFDAWVASRLDAWDLASLASFREIAPHGRLAHPTVEHYAPLLVAAGAADVSEPSRDRPSVTRAYEGFEHGTISLRCAVFD
jgi:4,5-DOPA dioxygenase extradiol